MSEKWDSMFTHYGADIRPFVEVSKWLYSSDMAAIFIYERSCILSVRKEQRFANVWDITVQHIISKTPRQNAGTRAILKLTLVASQHNYGVRIAYAISPGAQGLCRRLIRSYGFSNTKNNVDELFLLFDKYLNPYTVYSPRDIKKYERTYYEMIGVRTSSPRRKRRKISYYS